MKIKLGTLKPVSPREVWPSEARDFTPWLAENMALLGETLGMELEVSQTEAPVGDFSADIFARDLATGRGVVIENQFGATDHDHLGKLLTYASGTDAYALVWVAEHIRDEHRQALEWLNERSDEETSLFALELEVLQIDDSAPAFKFKPVVTPNKWQKATRTAARATSSQRAETYRAFFQQLIDELREVHHFTGARVAFPQNWYSFASGFQGATYGASFALGDRIRIDLYLDRPDAEANKRLFDWLLSRREEIESKLGSLQWERLDDKKASRVAVYRPGNIDAPQADLAEYRAWIVKQLLSFRDVFGALLKQHPK